MPGFLSDQFPIPTGIPQGSLISPILFLLFNAPLIRALYLRTGAAETEVSGLVDDAATLVGSESYHVNVKTLEKVMERANK